MLGMELNLQCMSSEHSGYSAASVERNGKDKDGKTSK